MPEIVIDFHMYLRLPLRCVKRLYVHSVLILHEQTCIAATNLFGQWWFLIASRLVDHFQTVGHLKCTVRRCIKIFLEAKRGVWVNPPTYGPVIRMTSCVFKVHMCTFSLWTSGQARSPKKNGGHIKSAQILVKSLHEPYQALWSASMSNGTINFAGDHHLSIGPASP